MTIHARNVALSALQQSGATTGQVVALGSSGLWVPTTISGSMIPLTSAQILVGNGSNVAAAVAMSGDTTISNTGVVTIGNDKVTYAKMQNVSATDKVLGRSTAGSGDVEEIACTSAGRALIDDADAAAQRTTLSLGNVENTALSTWAGSANITTLGAVASLTSGLPLILSCARKTATATGAGDVTLITYTVPANTLGSTKAIRCRFSIRKTTGSSNVTVKATFGGTSIYTGVATAYALGAMGVIEVFIYADNATNAQRCWTWVNTTGTGKHSGGAATAIDSTANANLVVTIDNVTDSDVMTYDHELVERVL